VSVLKSYSVGTVHGDRYGGMWPSERGHLAHGYATRSRLSRAAVPPPPLKQSSGTNPRRLRLVSARHPKREDQTKALELFRRAIEADKRSRRLAVGKSVSFMDQQGAAGRSFPIEA